MAEDGNEKSILSKFPSRYLEGVGLVIYDSGLPNDEESKSFWNIPSVTGVPKDSLFATKANGWNPLLVQIDANGNRVPWDRYMVTARLQNRLDVFGKDAGSATFSYTSGDSDSLDIAGALILDLYAPGKLPLFGYGSDERDFGFSFRVGAQYDRASSMGESSLDNREYFLGFSFLAPIFDVDGLRGAQASKMDFGYHIYENRITGESSDSLALEWKPAYKKLFGRDISLTDFLKGEAFVFSPAEDSDGDSDKPGQGKTNLEPTKKGDKKTAHEESKIFFQPRIQLEQFVKHATGKDDGFCGCAGLDMGVKLINNRLHLKYSIDAAHSFDEGATHVYHQISADLRLDQFKDLSLSASYVSGRRAPDYVDEDLFRLGAGIQF